MRRSIHVDAPMNFWWWWYALVIVAAGMAGGLPRTLHDPPGWARCSAAFALVALLGAIVRVGAWLVRRVQPPLLRGLILVALPLATTYAISQLDWPLWIQTESASTKEDREAHPTHPELLDGAIGCRIEGAGPGAAVARGFYRELARLCPRNDAAPLQARFELSAHDPGCGAPMFLHARWGYRVEVRLGDSRSRLEGNLERLGFGPLTCRSFDEGLGRSAAADAVQELHALRAQVAVESRKQASRKP